MIEISFTVPLLDKDNSSRLDGVLLQALSKPLFVKYCELLRLRLLEQKQLELAELLHDQFGRNRPL